MREQRLLRVGIASVLLMVAVGAATGCSSAAGSPSATDAEGTAGEPTYLGPTVKAAASRPPDPLASPYTPVTRPGKNDHHTIRAKASSFTSPVVYRDGVKIKIFDVAHGVTSGHGPGTIVGRTLSTFKARFFNGSSKPVDLNRVVVTVTYGHPARVAAPVYQASARDFGGVVKPGHSATAVYSFAVPKAKLRNVTMRVDFDGRHASATFKGSLK